MCIRDRLMGHGTATNSIELSGDTKSFDRVARKWNVDYAFYKTGSDNYLLFFKAGQACLLYTSVIMILSVLLIKYWRHQENRLI